MPMKTPPTRTLISVPALPIARAAAAEPPVRHFNDLSGRRAKQHHPRYSMLGSQASGSDRKWKKKGKRVGELRATLVQLLNELEESRGEIATAASP